MGMIRVGIGGWSFPAWRGSFYPKGLRQADELAYAAGHLTSIEINGTFYRHQSLASFTAWRDAVPEGFVFSVKAHQATTHGKTPELAVPRFLASGVTALGDRLGPVLWQFPHYRKFNSEVLRAFLALLPSELDGVRLRHAVEARHASFAEPAATALFRDFNVAFVVVDSDKQALLEDMTAEFAYVRLQRNDAAAPEGYASSALDAWAQRAERWAAAGRDVFVYFIAGDKQRAPDAAMALLGRLRR